MSEEPGHKRTERALTVLEKVIIALVLMIAAYAFVSAAMVVLGAR